MCAVACFDFPTLQTGAVLVHYGCCDKIPQTGKLRNVFVTVLEAGSPSSGCSRVGFGGRPLRGCRHLLVISHGRRARDLFHS